VIWCWRYVRCHRRKPRSKLLAVTFIFSEQQQTFDTEEHFCSAWDVRDEEAFLLLVALNDVTVPWPLCSSGVSTERKVGHRSETAAFTCNCITPLNSHSSAVGNTGKEQGRLLATFFKVRYCCFRACQLSLQMLGCGHVRCKIGRERLLWKQTWIEHCNHV